MTPICAIGPKGLQEKEPCFNLRILHCKAEFVTSGPQMRSSQDRDNLCFPSTHKEVVVLQRHMNNEEVVRHEACADVANVGEGDSPPYFD